MSDVFFLKEVDNSRTFGLGHFCIPGTGKIGGLRNRWMGFAPNMGAENSLTTSTTLPPGWASRPKQAWLKGPQRDTWLSLPVNLGAEEVHTSFYQRPQIYDQISGQQPAPYLLAQLSTAALGGGRVWAQEEFCHQVH